MKISSETENQLLPTTAPALESNIDEKGVAGHSPWYPRAKTFFEVEAFGLVRCYYFVTLVLTYFRLTKDGVTFFRPKTVITSSLHMMVLIDRVFTFYFPKSHFMVLLVAY